MADDQIQAEEQPNYYFGDFYLEIKTRKLRYKGEERAASDKILEFLYLLCAQPGELVDKDTILDQLWPKQFVSEASLSRLVSDTRQLLAKDDAGTEFIHTIRGKGFRFNPAIEITSEPHPLVNTPQKRLKKTDHLVIVTTLLLTLVTVFLLIWKFIDKPATYTVDESTILVLPVHVKTGDDQDAWVEYGVMTLLNQQLQAYESINLIDVRSTISGLQLINFDHNSDNTQKFDSVCDALGCEVLLVAELTMEDAQPVLQYRLYRENFRSPVFKFINKNILQSAQMLTEHALNELLPIEQTRRELKPLYGNDAVANQNFALGANSLYKSDYSAAEAYLKLAIERQADFFWAKAFLADCYYRMGDLQNSQKAVNELKNSTPGKYAKIFLGNLESNIAYALGQLETSQSISESLLPLTSELNDFEWMGNLLMNIGTTWTALGDTKKAQHYLEQAIAIFDEHGFRLKKAQALFNLGNAIHIASPNSAVAVDSYRQAAALFRQFDAKAYLAYALSPLGELKRSQGKFSEARQVYREVADLCREVNDAECLLIVETNLASVDISENKFELAEEHALKAFEGAGQTFSYVRAHSAQILSQIYLSTQQPDRIPTLLEEVDKFQWFDPRPEFSLLSASYAHSMGEFEQAIQLAMGVKEKLGDQWNTQHQSYLDLFIESQQQNAVIPMNYLQGTKRKPE